MLRFLHPVSWMGTNKALKGMPRCRVELQLQLHLQWKHSFNGERQTTENALAGLVFLFGYRFGVVWCIVSLTLAVWLFVFQFEPLIYIL
jgi:hypothetical protein